MDGVNDRFTPGRSAASNLPRLPGIAPNVVTYHFFISVHVRGIEVDVVIHERLRDGGILGQLHANVVGSEQHGLGGSLRDDRNVRGFHLGQRCGEIGHLKSNVIDHGALASAGRVGLLDEHQLPRQLVDIDSRRA